MLCLGLHGQRRTAWWRCEETLLFSCWYGLLCSLPYRLNFVRERKTYMRWCHKNDTIARCHANDITKICLLLDGKTTSKLRCKNVGSRHNIFYPHRKYNWTSGRSKNSLNLTVVQFQDQIGSGRALSLRKEMGPSPLWWHLTSTRNHWTIYSTTWKRSSNTWCNEVWDNE